MREPKRYDDDDGRTVADMSGIERQPLLLPRLPRKRRDAAPPEEAQTEPQPAWSKEDRRALISGALGAALLIGAIFVAAGALVIAFLLLLWK